MATTEPLMEVECAWCGKNLLVNMDEESTAKVIDCFCCGRRLYIHHDGIDYYSTRVTQNTLIKEVDYG